MRARSILAASAAAITIFATASSALADNVTNNLDLSIDASAESMPLNVGSTGSTRLAVDPENDDEKNGCNLTGSTTLVVDVLSSDSAVATVTPSRVTFSSCGATPTLTVTAVKAGSSTISLKEFSNDSQGAFNLAPATFTVNVSGAATANTPPQVSVTGVTAGASYAKGSVPAASCEVVDAEDGPSSFAATLSGITGPYAADGIGSQTASCSYEDDGGLVATGSVTYSIIDASAPVISYELSPATADGENGWYRSNVALTWHVTDAESPSSVVKTGCVDQSITSDQPDTAYSCSATSAGGTAATQTVSIKRDATAPTVSYTTESGTHGSNGWFTSPVTVSFAVTDATSGAAAPSVTAASGADEQGGSVTVGSPAVSDLAGNVTPPGAASGTYKIDLMDPTATFDSDFGASHYFGDVPAQPTCTAHDDVSGPAGCVVTGYSTTVGDHTLTATATDNAGRTDTAQFAYTVKAWTISAFYQPVDMGGVWNTVKGGSTVPLKFEVFAGTKELTDPAVIDKFVVNKVSCGSTTATEDAVELTTTGGTALRYDATSGQFIQNWQTPKSAGTCYSVKVTTDDGSSSNLAFFKLK